MSLEDRARMTRQVLESTPRRVVAGHDGYEPSVAPMAPPAPPPVPTLGERVEWHGKFWSSVRNIGIGVLFVLGAIWAGLSWAVQLAMGPKLEESRKQCADAIGTAVAHATQPIEPLAHEQKRLKRRENKDDQRWDRLDAWLQSSKRPNTIAPPRFGPASERVGAVIPPYNEPEEE